MKKDYLIFILFSFLASCKIINASPNPCFSCSTAEKDSCQMTDFHSVFTCKKADTTETDNFSRCGTGTLNTIQFNYSGYSNTDSALIKVFADSMALYLFPVALPHPAGDKNYVSPAIPYKKEGYFELPLPGGIAFSKYCTVSFVLRSGSGQKTNPATAGFQNIFLQWAPKSTPGAKDEIH